MATAEQIKEANKTSRWSPAIGEKAITPKMVREYLEKTDPNKELNVLDYGAGKTANHARALVEDGYNVLAHEFGDNIDKRYHCELALLNKYEVVYASNVLNVQADEAMLRETLAEVKSVMTEDGVFFANYPVSPRKSGMTVKEMQAILTEQFEFVMRIGGTSQAPLWIMNKFIS